MNKAEEELEERKALKEAIGESMRKRHEEKISKSKSENLTRNVIKDIEESEKVLRREVEASRETKLKGLSLNDFLDDIAAKIQVFEKNLSEYSGVIPQYELRKAQQSVRELRATFQDIQKSLQPKKKFGFSKLKKESTQHKDANNESVVNQVEKELRKFEILTDSGLEIKDKHDEVINLDESEVKDKDLLLNNLEKCTLKIRGNPSTLHMTNLKECRVISGPVSTSIFVEKCVNCTFVISCQQLRTHETRNSDFHLNVTSRAIIEYSSDIRFGPYLLEYQGLDKHLEQSGLGTLQNHDKIDDFNWLANDTPSPNFRLMKEDEFQSFNI